MMKTCIFIFLMVACLAAYVQGQTGSRPATPRGGGGAMGTMQGQSAGSMSSVTPQPDPYKQPPDRILKWNPQLSSKLATLLPTGMTAEQACSGFKRMGDCGAAIHVSHNLGISFSDLKMKLTGDAAQPMADAIHVLKPDVNAKAEAKKGEKQADRELWDARVL